VKPWEKYQAQAPDTGAKPWERYAPSGQVDPATNQPHGVPVYQPPGVEGYDPATGEVTPPSRGVVDQVVDKVGAFATGAADLPVVGPAVKAGTAAIAAGATAPFADNSFGERYDQMRGRQEQWMEENPGTAMAGQIAGTMAVMAPAATTATGAKLLGITGKNLATRALASGTTNAVVGGADTAVRGGTAEEVAGTAAISGVIGGAIPVVGAGIQAGARAIGDKVAPFVNAVRNPAQEAQRRVGTAVSRDMSANPTGMLSAADEAVAAQYGTPLLNVDRGGETTRAIARSVANQSPEARALIEKTASDRFAGQAPRAVELIKRVAGGNVDDIALQQSIRDAARAANKPAYNRAYNAPAAQAMWDEGFEQLMQAPAMQRAASQATSRGANRAAAEGFTPVKNPFKADPETGRLVLAQADDGTVAKPTLQFWDQVKRNLDGLIGRARRGGDDTLAGDLTALKSQLVAKLDDAVPGYRSARQGAAAFFGAEDAVDAGKKFANSPKAVPETKAAYSKFTDAEKKGFATGYASELIDRINASNDRRNVINSTFKSPASREAMEMVFGPAKMKEIEAFVRVEDIVDQLRGAMGNSTTARQLVELGIGAMGGGYMTGDLSGAAMGALAVKGGRAAIQHADNAVMVKMANLLTSNDPRMITGAVNLAKQSPKHMQVLEAIGNALALPVRAGAVVGATGGGDAGDVGGERKTLELTVRP
jgi:hypothetical protein